MPILVASLGGMPKNPNWYYNVKAHPAVMISTTQGHGNYIAEEVSKKKKDELWPLICSFYPDYETYQSNTSREIPVFLCKPA
jgi:deazaflavin-dependent oxidoreductase (nitroreductase family)